jgi:hypothetical protein
MTEVSTRTHWRTSKKVLRHTLPSSARAKTSVGLPSAVHAVSWIIFRAGGGGGAFMPRPLLGRAGGNGSTGTACPRDCSRWPPLRGHSFQRIAQLAECHGCQPDWSACSRCTLFGWLAAALKQHCTTHICAPTLFENLQTTCGDLFVGCRFALSQDRGGFEDSVPLIGINDNGWNDLLHGWSPLCELLRIAFI